MIYFAFAGFGAFFGFAIGYSFCMLRVIKITDGNNDFELQGRLIRGLSHFRKKE